jgi:hypothetical protein
LSKRATVQAREGFDRDTKTQPLGRESGNHGVTQIGQASREG